MAPHSRMLRWPVGWYIFTDGRKNCDFMILNFINIIIEFLPYFPSPFREKLNSYDIIRRMSQRRTL